MQPKPIDSRRLLDIDAQKRLVDMEGMQHLRGVRGEKDHPADTDYDVIHDEEGRRNQEQAAEQFLEKRKKSLADLPQKPKKPAKEEPREEKVSPDGKGSRLDVEA